MTRREVQKRFAPWFKAAKAASGRTSGSLSNAARYPARDAGYEAFEIKSTEIDEYASGARAPMEDGVIRLATLLPASVTDALWHSYPYRLIGMAEEIANGDGDPTRLWRVETFGSPQEWAQAVMRVPVAHAAALLYCYLGPLRRGELPLRNALLKESESHQAQYFDALAHAKRRSRQNPTLEMAEMVLAGTKVNFSSRVSAAGILVMPWAIAVAQALFVGALKGWHPVTSLPESTDLSDRINTQIRRNSSGAMTLTHRLGRPGDGKRRA